MSFLLLAFAASAQESLVLEVDINLRNATVRTFTEEFKSQTGIVFSYESAIGSKSLGDVAVNGKGSLESLLSKAISKSSGFDWSVVSNTVILSWKDPAKFAHGPSSDIVSGVVKSEQGEPLPYVGVLLVGTTTGVLTDLDGNYSIEIPNIQEASLEFSSLNFETVIENVSGRKTIDVIMKEDTQVLDEIVVIGYGTASKRLVSSSISTVKMDEIDRGADLDPIKALQGRAPGVSISSASGIPGASPNVIVRGVSSLSGSSSPLYVVDGIPAESYPNINASDIESMEVLKDASATAIYGSRANSGVIIVTTKSGKKGMTKVDVSAQSGVANIAKDIKMANTSQYIAVMQEAIDNYNLQKGEFKTLYIPENLTDFDWVAAISRKFSWRNSANASLQGGTDKTLYFVSFGAEQQEGYLNKTEFNKYTVRTKFSQEIAKWLKLNLNLSGSFSRYDQTEETDGSLKVLRAAREEQPWYTPYCTRTVGSYGIEYRENATSGDYRTMSSDGLLRHNPVMCINEEDYYTNKLQLQGTVSFDITPFDGFKFTTSLSGYGIYDKVIKKLTELNTERGYKDGWHALSEQKNTSFRYVFDNVASYDNKAGLLSYNAMVGHSWESYQYETFGAASDNYANSAFPSSSFNLITSGSQIYPGSIGYNAYALESYFARAAMNWDDRYIFNASFRADGSTRFPKDNRFGFFPAASLAWIVTNEKFMPQSAVLDELKVRVSAGQTGSMAGIGNWAAMDLVSAGSAYNNEAGLAFSTPAQGLKWEKSTKYDVGVDAEFFNGRLSTAIDVYNSVTNGLLYTRPVIATSGYTSLTSNVGAMSNVGLELSVNGTILENRDWKWTMGGNISFSRNRLESLIDDNDIIPISGANLYGGTKHALITGKPVSTWYMLECLGIYQDDEDVPETLYAKGVRAGDLIYRDVNGDGDIDYNDDRVECGKATPDFFGGLSTSVSWKGLSLDIFCQYSVGGKIFAAWKGCGQEGTEHLGLSSGSITDDKGQSQTSYFNVSEYAALNYWRDNSSKSSYTLPRPIIAGVHTGWDVDYNILTSTRYLEDASYFKFKTITLSYSLPDRVINNTAINRCKFFLTVDNALTLTKYDGYDPEVSMSNGPASANYGVDFGYQPTLRSYLLGFQLTF